MVARFEFATATRVVFGSGSVRETGELARKLGDRVLVVTGSNPDRAGPLLSSLKAADLATILFSITGEPDLDTVRRGVSLARDSGCDLVIGFGGGSALDAGKAIAAMLTNDGDLMDYLEVIGGNQPLKNLSESFIAIPTTAGTGTEVTRNAVLASPQHKVKVSLRSSLMLPRVAVVDPELTYALPPALTASTGLDALTQLVEPYVCSRANPITDALCLEGIRRVSRSLRRACSNSQDAAAREDMSLASLFGGFALANAGLGAVHGFAGPIGGMFVAPHGAVCAALLPHVYEANLRALKERHASSESLSRFETVARELTNNPSARAEDGLNWIRGLVADLRIPGLRAYGIKPAHGAELVEKAAKASSMKANPIQLTDAELTAILEHAL